MKKILFKNGIKIRVSDKTGDLLMDAKRTGSNDIATLTTSNYFMTSDGDLKKEKEPIAVFVLGEIIAIY